MVHDGFIDHKVFCAIDESHYEEALLQTLRAVPYSKAIKLGMTFFNAHGLQGVKNILEEVNELLVDPASLFLDLKFHDIPMQVAGAIKSVMALEPEFLTLHIAGGRAMMEAAVKAAHEEAQAKGIKRPQLLGVTVLTSMDKAELEELGVTETPEEQVLRLAKIAKDCGLDGVVCSPLEIARLRHELGDEFILMVPGIRPAGVDQDDQKRVMRPSIAIQDGATHLVIGRPITQSDDPAAMVQYIQSEIERC